MWCGGGLIYRSVKRCFPSTETHNLLKRYSVAKRKTDYYHFHDYVNLSLLLAEETNGLKIAWLVRNILGGWCEPGLWGKG